MASVTLTINGQEVMAQAGQTILEAAKASGIEIPTLCHHRTLKPIGACRVCLVEISGQRALQPACTFPVANGLQVETESAKVNKARRFVLELIFSERNHFCMYCEMSGDCELQKLAYRFGLDHMTYPTYTQRFPVDGSPKYHLLDHNRCVLCRRCIRACAELVGNRTLDLRQRGASTMVNADMDLPIGESSCVSCGTCINVCPTGALTDKRSAFMGREGQTEKVKSVCGRCSVGCGIDIVTRGGNVLRVEGNWDASVNDGILCEKGRFELLYEKRPRILTPLLRKDGDQQEVSWEIAAGEVAARLAAVPANRLGVLASSGTTNEALTLLVELFGTEIKAAHMGILNGVAPRITADGHGSLADISRADRILLAGVDPERDQPVASFLIKCALDRGAGLMVLDGGQTGLAARAESVLTANDVQQAVEMLRQASTPVVLYGDGIGDETARALQALEGKASFVALQPGVNTARAEKLGMSGGPLPKGLALLFVLAGEEDFSGNDILCTIGPEVFVVVQAAYSSPLTQRADVVLPSAIWSERSGTLTNTDGVVQPVVKATEPLGEAKPDGEILALLGEKLSKRVRTVPREPARQANPQIQGKENSQWER